jgi:Na+/melibiose symporter-like transporter
VPLTRLQNDKEAQINNDEVKNTSTMYFLRQRDIQINMVIMVYIWCVCSINSSILSYSVVDLPGDIYKNTFGSTLAEITATICATFIYANLQAEKTFVISFCLAIFGGFLVVTSGEIYADLMPAFVILAKLGLSSANLASQIAQVELFPTLFCATSLGICSFASNLATIVAPYLA